MVNFDELSGKNMWEGEDFGPVGGSEFKPVKAAPHQWIPDKLPEDIESEASFLATCCAPGRFRDGLDACMTLEESDFVHPTHKVVFTALRSLQKADTEVNALTIKSEVERMGKLDRIGGVVTIIDLFRNDDVKFPMVLAGYILEKSRLRKLIHAGAQMIKSASSLGDSKEIISEASEAITRLAMDNPGKQIIEDMSDLIDDLLAGKAITTENGGKAMSWGDTTLDQICPIPRGEPTLVVARPGVGKSALAIQIMTATIERDLGRPLFLSLEMGREKVRARMAAHLSGVNSRAFRDAQYDGSSIQRVISRKDVLSGMKIMFPSQQCQVEEIESLVKHAVDAYGCTCVVLDQFSHVHPPREAKKEIFAIANSMLSQKLTALAKNLNLGWVTLGQINRDGEDSRRPNMKDLADTDRLAKDAAVIFGLWNKGTDENQEVWGTLIKNRDDGFKGWARRLEVDYGTCRFRTIEQETKAYGDF